LNYGKEKIVLNIPKQMIAWQAAPMKATTKKSFSDLVKDSLDKPINAERIEVFGKGKKNAIVVIDDNTRPTPIRLVLPEVIKRLKKAGIESENIKILVALGTHRKMTEDELIEKCGEDIFKSFDVVQHDYLDKNNLVNVGLKESDLPISINKTYYNSDFKIVIGNIIPHIDAGWSGGAKILLPGICGKDTINSFHLKSTLNKSEIIGKTENCMRADMERVAAIAGLDYIINTILDIDDNLADIVSGHYVNAHRKGVELAKKFFEIKEKEKADIVLVSGYPADEDFWQAGKAVSTAEPLVKEGGIILLISPCYGGIAPDHPILLELSGKDPKEVIELIERKEIDDLAGAAVYIDVFKAKEKSKIIVYSQGISKKDAKKIGFQKIDCIDSFLKKYISDNPFNRIGVINRGTEIVPRLEN